MLKIWHNLNITFHYLANYKRPEKMRRNILSLNLDLPLLKINTVVFYKVTLREDCVWCTCADFQKHRLICKHMWCVIDESFENLPESYKMCAEFNSSA